VGAVGAKELLELMPCDMFPYIRGRTLWLVGDSMMQVGAAVDAPGRAAQKQMRFL
jgi:hypothetical protein